MSENPQLVVKCSLCYCSDIRPGFSPYRLVDAYGNEIPEVNDFLDAQATRGLSLRSLRAYGYSLLNFWRWPARTHKSFCELQEADLLEYLRFQRALPKKAEVAPKTLNHRLTTVRCLFRFHCGKDLPSGRGAFRARSHPFYHSVASENGYLHPARPRLPQLHVKEPQRVVLPLTAEEVRAFLENLRSWRDLSIVALMLFCGLRSQEVLNLTLTDIALFEGESRIHGKGGKERVVPLPAPVIAALQSYVNLERPPTKTPSLFLALKGQKRGQPMTTSGLRSLFRYHRTAARVAKANPHRFRHTFGSDMARAGISLPALMKLMGHADIHTTMIYVELSPKDVWEEFQRVVRSISRDRISLKGGQDGE